MAAPHAFVDGIGFRGPGLPDWPATARVLAGQAPWTRADTVLPAPALLPPAERRRTGPLVRLTLATGLEAAAHAGRPPESLAAVFASSGGDGTVCHEICATLASASRALSPTRFHNSVHNAAAGYWGIATGATAPASALCAGDGSFGAGLLEALAQVAVERAPVLLIAYDASYPEPLHSVRPIPHACAVALVLVPAAGARSLARVEIALSARAADTVAHPALEALRRAVPAARSLPLLAQLAAGGAGPGAAGPVVLDYLDDVRLGIEVSPCR